MVVYPLSSARRSYGHALASRDERAFVPGQGATGRETLTARVPAHTLAPARLPVSQPARHPSTARGVRAIAWSILALFPVAVTVWAATIILPIAIEARQASGAIFVTPAPREHFTTPVAVVPTAPSAMHTPEPPGVTPAPDATPTESLSISSPQPGVPSATSAPATPTSVPPWDGKEPISILLLGVDRRAIQEGDVGRSDTMIVVRIDPVAKRIDMVSIPRDLLVEIPGYYATKINAAYPLGEVAGDLPGGGPTLAAQTIEFNFGIWIDYFAEVDIAGMERIIDIIGGIMIDVPRIVKDDQYPTDDFGLTRVYFTPGIQRMDGVAAVRYSRTRHDDGDFARQHRQHEVLRAIRAQVEVTGIITRLSRIIDEIGDSLRTDVFSSMSLRQVTSLAQLGQDIGEENVYSHSLLPYVSEAWIDEGYYLIGDWVGLRALFADFTSDPYTTREETATATPPIEP
ncbi:MAG TPA: LCP family protein [Thermomicrobiales bacterium]|nr:LCP family protein [Thermomicrobiales bacterium]